MTDLLSGAIFLDLEASSLAPDGWPIEIGLTWIDELDELVTWSSLIRPHPSWSNTAWCADAEAIHRLTRADLLTARSAEDVATEANAMIEGRLMISDGRKADTRWLDQFLASAGRPLHIVDPPPGTTSGGPGQSPIGSRLASRARGRMGR